MKTIPGKKEEEKLTIEKEEAKEEPKKESKPTDNPDVDLDQFMKAMKKFGVRKEDGEKVQVLPRQIREELGRPIGAKYHQKLMKAANTLVEQELIVVAKHKGKRTYYFKLK